MKKKRIAIFASGSGSNAEEIMKRFSAHPSIEVGLMLSNNPTAFALERARRFGIPTHTFTREEFRNTNVVLDLLQTERITHIVLAGFLWLIPDYLIERFPDRIINIHPALLPQFGGKGMFGMKVHEAVKAAGAVETGITIHLVNDRYDEGKIVFQSRCGIEPGCDPSEIARRVHTLEYEHYPRVIEEWINET